MIIFANFIALLPYGIAQTLWFRRFFRQKVEEERIRAAEEGVAKDPAEIPGSEVENAAISQAIEDYDPLR